MKKIITIGGSNSKQSINKILAESVGSMINNTEKINIDLNDFSAPIYSVDIEGETGIPASIIALNELFDTSDGFVVSLAEHNGSYSVAFKNAFDWLSRVNKYVFRDKPMLLLSTSPGGRGGATVLETAKTTFPHLGGNIINSIAIPSFYDNFKDGKIVNPTILAEVKESITTLSAKI